MNKLNRRKFLKTTGIAASATFVLPRFSIAQTKSPNSKINIALIGIGGIGGMSLRGCAGENIVAMCDFDNRVFEAPRKRPFPTKNLFTDYRKMLDKVGKEIDAVCISTPDHSHFKITMDCMSAGKHVAVQKPLTHDLWQCRELRKAKAYYPKLKTQMMNQGHASENIRYAKEWYEAGILGNVNEVHVWNRHPEWGGRYFQKPASLPLKGEDIPKDMDWDLWIADANYAPYSRLLHPETWRSIWDYGTGILGDWFCHTADTPVFALDLDNTLCVECEKRDVNFDGEMVIPNSSKIRWDFPATKKRPALSMYWYDGGELPTVRPKDWIEPKRGFPDKGGMWMIGDKNTLSTGSRPIFNLGLINKDAFMELKKSPPAKKYPRAPKGDLYQEWFADIRGEGPEAGSNFNYASQITEIALLGVLAQRFGGKIEWDSKNLKVKNRPELNAFVKPTQRKGWETKPLPTV